MELWKKDTNVLPFSRRKGRSCAWSSSLLKQNCSKLLELQHFLMPLQELLRKPTPQTKKRIGCMKKHQQKNQGYISNHRDLKDPSRHPRVFFLGAFRNWCIAVWCRLKGLRVWNLQVKPLCLGFETNNTVDGCFLKWWYPQNTPKWSFLVGKPWWLGTSIFGNAQMEDILHHLGC